MRHRLARADDEVSEAERVELDRIGRGRDLDEYLMAQLIDQHLELD
jgi:hypothetical protein